MTFDHKRVMPGLKASYRAEAAVAAEAQLDAFEAECGSRYPAVTPARRPAREHVNASKNRVILALVA